MNTLASPEIYGIGAVAVALIAAGYRLLNKWIEKNGSGSDRRILIDIVQKNATAIEKFAGSVDMLRRSTDRNTDATLKMEQTLTALLLKNK